MCSLVTAFSKVWRDCTMLMRSMESELLNVLIMASLGFHVWRTKKSVSTVSLPLYGIVATHQLTWRSAIKRLDHRAGVCKAFRDELLNSRVISAWFLTDILGSRAPIVVVQLGGVYYALEGNGRLAALRSVFPESDGLLVEAREVRIERSDLVVKALRSIQERHSLE